MIERLEPNDAVIASIGGYSRMRRIEYVSGDVAFTENLEVLTRSPEGASTARTHVAGVSVWNSWHKIGVYRKSGRIFKKWVLVTNEQLAAEAKRSECASRKSDEASALWVFAAIALVCFFMWLTEQDWFTRTVVEILKSLGRRS